MVWLQVRVTPEELHARMEAARRQGVSMSDHLRVALGMRPLGDPPMFAEAEPRGRLRLVHERRQPEWR
jgi:hypothetical protein